MNGSEELLKYRQKRETQGLIYVCLLSVTITNKKAVKIGKVGIALCLDKKSEKKN